MYLLPRVRVFILSSASWTPTYPSKPSKNSISSRRHHLNTQSNPLPSPSSTPLQQSWSAAPTLPRTLCASLPAPLDCRLLRAGPAFHSLPVFLKVRSPGFHRAKPTALSLQSSHTHLFDSHSLRQVPSSLLFYRWRKWDPERLSACLKCLSSKAVELRFKFRLTPNPMCLPFSHVASFPLVDAEVPTGITPAGWQSVH